MIDTGKIQKAIALIHEANGLIQSAGIPQPDFITDDPVYQIHNILENTAADIEEVLADSGITVE